MLICPQCGTAYQDQTTCPQDGAVLVPPATTRKRMLIGAIIGVVCIALGVGLFFTIQALQRGTRAPAGGTQWANGYQSTWSIKPDWSGNPSVLGQNDSQFLLLASDGWNNIQSVMDMSTGETVWLPEDTMPGCEAGLFGDEVWCIADDGHDLNAYYRFDAATGKPLGNIDVSKQSWLATANQDPDHDFSGFGPLDGMFFASFSPKQTWSSSDYALARLSDDATSVLWQTSFTYSPNNFYRQTGRLHHGVLTNNQMYAISVDDGTALPICNSPDGCTNIEWVADNVLMGQPDGPQSVTFPDGTKGALTREDAIYVTSDKLPPIPMRLNGGAIEGFDALTGKTLWSTRAPKLASSQPGLASYPPYAAYDGQRVVLTNDNGYVLALNPNNGSVLWQVTLPLAGPRTMPDFMDDGLLLIQQANYPDEQPSSDAPGALYALNSATGATWWTIPGQVAGTQVDTYPFLGDAASLDSILVQTIDGTITRIIPQS